MPTAKAMLAGIISDTVILKCPTTTAVDILSAKQLSEICGVSVEDFGTEMFSHMSNLKNLDPDIAIKSDFKSYKER